MACDLTGNWFIVEARYRDALLVDWSWPELGTSVPGSECRHSWLLERARLINPALLVCE